LIGVMMLLGNFRFSVSTTAYQTFAHSSAYRWQAQERYGQQPAMQYTGPGEESITPSGDIYPSFAGGIAGLAVDQKAKQPLVVAIGHDPHRQQHGFARHVFDPQIDMHVAFFAGHLFGGDRGGFQVFETLSSERARVLALHAKLLDGGVFEIELVGIDRLVEIERADAVRFSRRQRATRADEHA